VWEGWRREMPPYPDSMRRCSANCRLWRICARAATSYRLRPHPPTFWTLPLAPWDVNPTVVAAMNDASRPPGLTIASLRNRAAGFPPDTPLLVPRADGEGYEPLVMASAANVGAHLTAASPTAGAAG